MAQKIPYVTVNWFGNTPRYCWPDNDPSLKDIYGAFYNWYTVQTGKLCPSGWHVPSDSEWHQLAQYFDPTATLATGPFDKESYIAGGFMKETGTAHWLDPNTGATNSSGFFRTGSRIPRIFRPF